MRAGSALWWPTDEVISSDHSRNFATSASGTPRTRLITRTGSSAERSRTKSTSASSRSRSTCSTATCRTIGSQAAIWAGVNARFTILRLVACSAPSASSSSGDSGGRGSSGSGTGGVRPTVLRDENVCPSRSTRATSSCLETTNASISGA